MADSAEQRPNWLRRALRSPTAQLSLAIGLILGVLWAWPHVFPGSGVGAACKRDDECASHRCLHATRPIAGIGDGYCTERCDIDADCPGGFACAQAEERTAYVLGSDDVSSVRACVKH